MKDLISKRPLAWFKFKKPDLNQEFKGRTITAYETAADARRRNKPVRVQVDRIVGNMRHATMFEINDNFLVSMLDAYSELNREPLPTREIHEAFLDTVMTHIRQEKKNG